VKSAEVIPVTERVRGAKMIAGAAMIYFLLRLIGFQQFFANAEGLSTLLQIIGTLYSVVYAFAIYVIWASLLRWKAKSRRSREH
jgi:hypothetical protein